MEIITKIVQPLFLLVLILFLSVCQISVCIAQTVSGYYYTYDDSGNRITRTYSATVLLKRSDTTTTEVVVSNTTIKFYPNPVKELLNVDIDGLTYNNTAQYELLDMQGIKIKTLTNTMKSLQIDMKDLPNGAYLPNIFIDGKPSYVKILKEN